MKKTTGDIKTFFGSSGFSVLLATIGFLNPFRFHPGLKLDSKKP